MAYLIILSMTTKDAVIIGGGIVGVSLLYYLARNGMRNVLLIERNYLGSGATGRCGGGVRQQWSTEINIKLAMLGREIFANLSDELGHDIEWHSGGYLIPVYTEEFAQQARKNVELQRKLGLKVELLKPEEIKSIVPQFNPDGVILATYCPTDGHANPFKTVFAYAKAAQALGTEIWEYCEVQSINRKGTCYEILTPHDTVATPILINAAGGWANIIAKMVGIELPTTPYRHEILVTEPVEHFLDPLIISFDGDYYFRQEHNGGIVGGMGNPDEPPGINHRSSLHFLIEFSHKLAKAMPILKDVRIIRQWAGLYLMSPDSQHIMGDMNGIDGYYQIVGFSGHGFMLGPISSKLLADYITDGKRNEFIDAFSYRRFEEGTIQKEVSVV